MRTPISHPWDVSPRRAGAIQRELAGRVERETPARFQPAVVAGLDAAFPTGGKECVAAAVAWSVRERRVLEERVVRRPLTFPYVPGLLSFREAPAVLAALAELETPADALLCDGHGLAHPRRFGLACHLGVLTGTPAVGCAKSVLVGEPGQVADSRGSQGPLEHRGERIGTVLRTRDRVRPVFVSIGHRMDLESAVELVLACAIGFRLPEPIRRADRLVSEARKL
ncbi:MAG: endonuclease V [Acidobacteria bacterium]|nr:endonuclease V [Acidobacteriota bacterium]MYE45063.1 endonuclease V [Acidobacteriota bacterium]